MTDATIAERRWDLGDLYPDDEAWHEDRRELESDVAGLEPHRGRLGASPSDLLAGLALAFDLYRRLEKLHTYASLRADEDLRVDATQGMRQSIEALGAELAEKSAWIDPEVLALPVSTIAEFLAAEPGLSPYRRYLERLEKRRAHTLDPERERLLGMAQLIRGDGATISSLLHDADIPWPTVELSDGSSLLLDSAGYLRGRTLTDREDRRRVFETFFGTLRNYRASLAASLYLTTKDHVFEARVRDFPSTLEAALSNTEVDPHVYRMLVREIGDSLPALHRYLRLRARILEVERLEYHDMYALLTRDIEDRYEWPTTRRLVLEALSPLGAEYVARLDSALTGRWVDVDARRGKRSGAYVNDGAYDAHPYMLLNHVDDYQSASTVAHESGHLMHSWLSQESQPYPTARYTIFVAEVASTLNEQLLFHHMYEGARDAKHRLSLLGHFLETLRATVFRQTMFAEFELEIHERTERGEPLTGDLLSSLYLGLLRRYHGHEQGVMNVDERYAVEWAHVPHFHYNFYVYQYATSFVAATALSRRLIDRAPETLESYLAFLRAGCTAPPVDLLRTAGVDMTRPEPIRECIREMNRVMDEIEAILQG